MHRPQMTREEETEILRMRFQEHRTIVEIASRMQRSRSGVCELIRRSTGIRRLGSPTPRRPPVSEAERSAKYRNTVLVDLDEVLHMEAVLRGFARLVEAMLREKRGEQESDLLMPIEDEVLLAHGLRVA